MIKNERIYVTSSAKQTCKWRVFKKDMEIHFHIVIYFHVLFISINWLTKERIYTKMHANITGKKETLKCSNYESCLLLCAHVWKNTVTQGKDIPMLGGNCVLMLSLQYTRRKVRKKDRKKIWSAYFFYSCLTLTPNGVWVNLATSSEGNSNCYYSYFYYGHDTNVHSLYLS